jgi:hypothetical protein
VQCPFHRKILKSDRRKWFGVCGPTLKDKQECAAAALEWCAAARRFSRQWMHLGFQVDYKASAAAAITRQNPIFSEDLPVQRCKPDSELDASDALLGGDAASGLPGVASEIGIGSASASSKQLAAPLRTSLKSSAPSQTKRRRLASPASGAPPIEESADICRDASSNSSSSSESMSSIGNHSDSSKSNSSSDSSSSSESSSDEE